MCLFHLVRRLWCIFTSEYENDPVGREKVDHSGERKDNQMSEVLEKVREGGEGAEWSS